MILTMPQNSFLGLGFPNIFCIAPLHGRGAVKLILNVGQTEVLKVRFILCKERKILKLISEFTTNIEAFKQPKKSP